MKFQATFAALLLMVLASAASAATFNLVGQTTSRDDFGGQSASATVLSGSVSGDQVLMGSIAFTNSGVSNGEVAIQYSADITIDLNTSTIVATDVISCVGQGEICNWFLPEGQVTSFDALINGGGFSLGMTFINGRAEWDNSFVFENVAEVPVPAAAWLFASALLGLVGIRKRA